MSRFTDLRDSFESFFSSAFHKGVAILEPIAIAVGNAATPVVEAALINAGKAVVTANANGTAHGSQDMINVAVGSLKADIPQLRVTVQTALAAAVVHGAAEAASQAQDAPLNVPPAQ